MDKKRWGTRETEAQKYMTEYMTVEEMQKRKRELGYSYEQIAKITGLPVGTVQKVLSGITKAPRYATMQALQRAFTVEDRLNDQNVRKGQGARPNVTHADFMIREEKAPYGAPKQWESGFDPAGEVENTPESKMPCADIFALIEAERALYDNIEPEGCGVEWIDGVRYDRSAPGRLHQILVMGIWRTFSEYVMKKTVPCSPLAALPAVLSDGDDRTIVWPDVMLLCDQAKVRQGRVCGTPDLVVEVVSGDTLIRDSHIKLARYAHAGVKEYWLVYPGQKAVVVYDFTKKEIPRIYEFAESIPVGIFEGDCIVNFTGIMSYSGDWKDQD